jgi:alanine racemase
MWQDGFILKSWVEISSICLVENLRAVQTVAASGAGAGVETLAVIKADAYGHGAKLVAPVLVGAGTRWLGVSDVDEGASIRQTLGQGSTRLLVMCGMEQRDAPALVLHGITPVVWTVEHIAAMERAARAAGQRVKVHLEIDTGMARQGAAPGAELAATLERLAASRWVACEGVMSHLAAAEVVAATPKDASTLGLTTGSTAAVGLTMLQHERLSAALEQVAQAGIRPDLLHLGNSSAVDEGSTMGWIREAAKKIGAKLMVRTGLALYGFCLEIESGASAARAGLLAQRIHPVLTWKTCIIGIREIAAKDTVGYGATFTANGPMRLALLPVGYADGFRRAASSGAGKDWVRGWVMIAGKRAPVVGRVSMNLTTVDVTAIPEAVPGAEVVLLGDGVTANDHARWSDTIPYDILCGIRARFEAL